MVVVLSHPGIPLTGARLLLRGEARHGTLPEAEATELAFRLAARGLEGEAGATEGVHALPLPGGGALEVYLELHHPRPELVIVGAGHLAQPLCTLGALLGLQVTVLDDRPRFATRERFPEAEAVMRVDFSDAFRELPLHPWSHVVLVTRGHRHDYECLRQLLRRDPLPGYIGMIGSRRRVKATFLHLMEEGISRERLEVVRAPIGLDLGAETPAEIAVSIAAEIVHHWQGGSCRPLQEAERVLGRLLPEEP